MLVEGRRRESGVESRHRLGTGLISHGGGELPMTLCRSAPKTAVGFRCLFLYPNGGGERTFGKMKTGLRAPGGN